MDGKINRVIGLVIGIVVLTTVMSSTLPLVFDLDFTNESVWGSFASSILPTVFPLMIGVGVLLLLLKLAHGFGGKVKL